MATPYSFTGWGRPALLSGTQTRKTYAQFRDVSARLAHELTQQGIQKGDRVTLFMGNHLDYLVTLYAIWFIGGIAVPINAKLHAREADWIIENADAKLTIGTQKSVKDLLSRTLHIDSSEWQDMMQQSPLDRPVLMDANDTAWLFYTSGTTGKPKGVMMTCGNIAAMAYNYFTDVDDVLPQDAILYAAPMSHGAGLYNFMHVMRGTSHVVPESGGFDPAEIFSLGESLGSITMFAAPTMVRRLVDYAKITQKTGEGIRTIVYAGGPMYEADILEAVEVMGPRFIQIYGQGECPMGITALSRSYVSDRNHEGWRERLNSVGIAQSAVQLRIVDKQGNELPAGVSGEITVRGTTVMKGYWDNPQATENTIRDGWLWTGDLGQMDEQGFLTLQDRSKDIIISGGSNIYPREVEEVILAHPEISKSL